jgi:serine/threonine protein kinase
VVKLADFGFAKKKDNISGTILGTENYIAPEIYIERENDNYGFEVDMWAFGVLFYFMLNMQYPFRTSRLMQGSTPGGNPNARAQSSRNWPRTSALRS